MKDTVQPGINTVSLSTEMLATLFDVSELLTISIMSLIESFMTGESEHKDKAFETFSGFVSGNTIFPTEIVCFLASGITELS